MPHHGYAKFAQKNLNLPAPPAAFRVLKTGILRMTTNSTKQCDAERTAAAMLEMNLYCKEHPRSPSALRRPRIMIRGSSCVALLGGTLQEGIAGIGTSVEAALRAFDVQYANSLKPPRG